MSLFTSTLIDDEQLIDELRRYGEKNLPTLPTGGTSRAKQKNQLNDSNREIYLKKLNHYKAKEKAELNPSKQYIKQRLSLDQSKSRNSLGTNRVKSENAQNYYDENDEEQNDEDDVQVIEQENDVIPLDSNPNETQYEYVKVSNAYTSPLSVSTFQNNFNSFNEYDHTTNNHDIDESIPTSSSMFSSTQAPPSYPSKTNYVNLKEKIDLEKTLSKYRSEINNIITNSMSKNRTFSRNLANEDVIYTGTVSNSNGVSSTSSDRQSNKLESQVMYCPRPSNRRAERRSIFDSIKSRFVTEQDENADMNLDNQHCTNRISSRAGLNKNSNLDNNNKNADKIQETIRKEPTFKQNFSNFFQNKFVPFASHLWVQFSKLLPYLVLIIFTIIALQYFRMRFLNDTTNFIKQKFDSFNSLSQKSSNDYVNEQKQNREHFYCPDIKDTQCSQTKALVRELIDYLRVKSGQVDCSPIAEANAQFNNDQDNNLSISFIEKCVHVNQIKNYLINERKLIKNKEFQNEAIESVLKAFFRNQHWNIRILDQFYKDTNELKDINYLMSSISSKSLSCRFKELLHFLYVRFIMLVSFAFTIFLGYLTYKALKNRRIEKDRKFFELIKQVTEVVEKQYELSLLDPANIKPYIAISHVFDTIIEPSQRASKKKQWNEVIKFIEDHESRIHLETQFIDGEETLVWKWIVPKHIDSLNNLKYANTQNKKNEGIGLANSTIITTNDQTINQAQLKDYSNKENTNRNDPFNSNGKANSTTVGWQGDAFNRSEKLSHSPTPCLKIRGMFDQATIDSDPSFSIKIHNDILEKCSTTIGKLNDSILHISCDKKSKEGCVYVKCMTNESAGRVYQALNGTWYNGKLLNVKFLRSDRYLERFPESINFSEPLKLIQL